MAALFAPVVRMPADAALNPGRAIALDRLASPNARFRLLSCAPASAAGRAEERRRTGETWTPPFARLLARAAGERSLHRRRLAEADAEGYSQREIADAVGVGRATVQRDMAGPNGPPEPAPEPPADEVPGPNGPPAAEAPLTEAETARLAEPKTVIEAAQVVEQMSTRVDNVPKDEKQARVLVPLTPAERLEVASRVVHKCGRARKWNNCSENRG